MGPVEAWAAETQACVLGGRLKPALGMGVGGQQSKGDDAVKLVTHRDSYSTGEAQEGTELNQRIRVFNLSTEVVEVPQEV